MASVQDSKSLRIGKTSHQGLQSLHLRPHHAFPSSLSSSHECLAIYLTDWPASYTDRRGPGLSGWLIYKRSGWLARRRQALNPYWAFLGLLGGRATHLPTVQADKGRSVPLGASRQRPPLPLTGRGRQRQEGKVS